MNSSESKKSGNYPRGRHRSSAESPHQPSPSVPPMPQDPPKPFLLPPWTPNPKHHLFQQHAHYIQDENVENLADLRKSSEDDMMGMIDDESLPSIPDVPSPYSPPPASLFSGEEFPNKSHRKPRPFDDFSLMNNQRLVPQSQSVFNSSIPSDEEYQSHQPYSHRQQLLPTILYLKKDLEESHASMHLLQQENKALAAECDRFQREMEHWNDQHTITVSEKDEQIAELKKQLNLAQQNSKDTMDSLRTSYSDCKEELAKISKQLEASVASNTHLEACNDQLKNEVATKETEIKNLRSTIKDQSLAAAAKLKETTAVYDTKLQLLQDECKSLTMETDRLKAMNVEAHHLGSKNLAKSEEAFQTELSAVQATLKESQKEMEDLRAQTASLKVESNRKAEEVMKLTQQLKDALAEESRKDAEIKGLRDSLLGSTEREHQLQAENENIHKIMEQKVTERNDEIKQLQQALQKAEADEKALQASASQMTEALRESYTKYGALRSEKEILEKELSSLRNQTGSASSTSSQERNQELESEIEKLKASLSKAVMKCNDLRAERSVLTKKLSQYSKSIENVPSTDEKKKSPDVFKFEDTGSDNDDLIPNRLERIRDAAERAAFAKEHRRELQRLKAEHDKEVKRLTARHEQDLKDVFEEAKAEVTARSREIRRHLQAEYETKLSNLERRYLSDLSRMQRECDKSTSVAEEAMKAAASELAVVTEQLDKESQAREALESNVRDLELKLVTEQQKNKLSSEWMMNRKQWQRATNNLIVAIQQECNTVFTQNLVRTDSPRSVVDASTCDVDTTEKSIAGMQILDDSCLSRIEQGAGGTSISDMPFPVHRTPWKKQVGIAAKTSYNSPLNVSQALDETEALVRSLVGK